MNPEKVDQKSSEISDIILNALIQLEKDIAHECLDYGQLTANQKERFIDEWMYFVLFRVDVLLFSLLEKEDRIVVKERIVQKIFTPLLQYHDPKEIDDIIMKSFNRFTEYVDAFQKRGIHADVYPLVINHFNEINSVIVKGTESPNRTLYSLLVQKNIEDDVTRKVKKILRGWKQSV